MANVEQPRVFVLEDHPDTRAQLLQFIENDPRLDLAGYAGDLESALSWFEHNKVPEAALIDLALPDGDGVQLIAHLRQQHPDIECIVITVFGDESHVVRAIEAGATGYLLKEQCGQRIADSILEVIGGGSHISPSIARLLLKRVSGQSATGEQPSPETPLTARELEVLKMTVKGYTYQEIANALEVSYHTVTSHVQHIYRKLSVRSRGEAVFEAIQLGLVSVNRSGPGTL